VLLFLPNIWTWPFLLYSFMPVLYYSPCILVTGRDKKKKTFLICKLGFCSLTFRRKLQLPSPGWMRRNGVRIQWKETPSLRKFGANEATDFQHSMRLNSERRNYTLDTGCENWRTCSVSVFTSRPSLSPASAVFLFGVLLTWGWRQYDPPKRTICKL
jgi:hypothetical protein